MKMIFLVDGDNNIGTGLQGADQLKAEDSILIFYQKTGLALSKIKELCKGSKASIQYLESVKGGKNSIDFQIITELGVLVGRGEADCAYVISQDKGYEAAMSALRLRYAGAFREVALRPSIAACLKAFYLLRAASAEELRASLQQEFGDVQGLAAYDHLQGLFQPAKPVSQETSATAKSAVPAPEDKLSAASAGEKAVKKSRNGRRRSAKSADAKPAEAKSTDGKSSGVKPAEAESTDGKSSGVKPAEAKPVGGSSEKPAAQPSAKGVVQPTAKSSVPTASPSTAMPTPAAKSSASAAPAPKSSAPLLEEKSAVKLVRTAHRGGRRKKKPAAEKPAGEA
ncbi:PIN domain-containing protein [Oscillibacter sp.]|uniref:PIN domain-containing protein n=1 Tax=Oscillibacter sp. TaxID=1945593 RepID=UPI0028ABF620|nr:PIN domain-containing protein [Oscillibacter sp.]